MNKTIRRYVLTYGPSRDYEQDVVDVGTSPDSVIAHATTIADEIDNQGSGTGVRTPLPETLELTEVYSEKTHRYHNRYELYRLAGRGLYLAVVDLPVKTRVIESVAIEEEYGQTSITFRRRDLLCFALRIGPYLAKGHNVDSEERINLIRKLATNRLGARSRKLHEEYGK